MRPAHLGFGIALSLALLCPLAHALPTAREVAAEEMFKAGRALLEEQRFAEACEKFDASESLDPAVGTLLSLGECYEGLGRDASAWFTYRAAVALAAQRNDVRRVIAERHASAVEPRLATILVRFAGDVAPHGADVALDGETFRYDPRGAPVPADPGSHAIKVSAPGFRPWSTRVSLMQQGQQITIDVPPLVTLPPQVSGMPSKRSVGIAAAGTGAIVFGVGAILGAQAIVKGRDANELCPSGGACGNAGAVQENNTAKGFADVATVMMPVGAVLLAGGAYLYVTSFRKGGPEVSAGVTPSGGRVNVAWSW